VVVSHVPPIGVEGFLERGSLERPGQGRVGLSRRSYSLVGSCGGSHVSLFFLRFVSVCGHMLP